MDIEDICIHEAAHALVYDALEITFRRIWIEEERSGLCTGAVERGKSPSDLSPALIVLEFMAGAAALFSFTQLPEERVFKKTESDFEISLRYLRPAYEHSTKRIQQWLEIAARGFVGDWLLRNRDVVIGLASELQRRRVRYGRAELAGDVVHDALTRNWSQRMPRDEVVKFAEANWAKVTALSEQLIVRKEPVTIEETENAASAEGTS